MTELDFNNQVNLLRSTGSISTDYRDEFSDIVQTLLDMSIQFYEEEILDENIFDNIVLDSSAIQYIKNGKKLDSPEEISSDINYLQSLLDGADMSDYYGTDGWRTHLEW